MISIIAVLALLALSAGQSAINSAKKTYAKNQAVQIATAIASYEAEYGRLPAFSGSTLSPDNVAMLCSTNDAANNPRGIIFLEASAWKNGKGGTNGSGFCDPFSSNTPYQVVLDTDYDNQISVPTNASGGASTIMKRVGVYSISKVGKTNVLINSWD